MDCIGHAKAIVGNAPAMRTEPLLSTFADLSQRLVGTPRYLLDDKATRTAVELNLGRPKILLEALRHVRIPYPRMWVEWDDASRQKLRAKFDEPMSYPELRPMPKRVGFLLETDDSGRRGHATWLWTSPLSDAANFPQTGAIEPFFDLDREFDIPEERALGLIKGNIAKPWLDNQVQLKALFDIYRTVEHKPSQWGEHYFKVVDPLHQALAYADVVGEYIMIWAIILLLTASRPVIELTPVTLDKLNKQRVKKGAVPLLDYTSVTLHLSEPDEYHNPVVRGPLGYMRKSPRVHLVSSYLARRGDKHWVVFPYMRGIGLGPSGNPIHRRIHVKG